MNAGAAAALAALLLAGLLATFLATPASARDCAAIARGDYERLYCRLVSEGHGSGLPAFEDFRRNTPQVQALLLRRPAQRAGLELPAESGPARAPVAAEPEPARPPPPQEPTPAAPRAQPGLADCRLLGEVIQCPDRRLALVENQPNRALPADALAQEQRLDLPRFDGDPGDDQALRQYLSDAYDHYLERMLDIGLGGATLSFSQFHHSYFRHRDQGVDFPKRMETMFQHLLQDKRTKSVPARLHGRLPETIENCMGIRPGLVVCDDVATNWVYRSEP